MGLGDKMANKTQEVVGKVKEGVGDLTDNERLEAEGKAEAKAKQAGEHVKDAASDVADGVKDVFK